jgi:hypothetical protein
VLRHSDDLIELGDSLANSCAKLFILAAWAIHLRKRALDPFERSFDAV